MANLIDRAHEYAERLGFSQQKQIFKYIKQGNREAIEKIMTSSSYIDDWEKVFGNDLAFARTSLEYSWSQACLVAIQDDIPEREVAGLFIKSQQQLWEVNNIRQALALSASFHIQLVECVFQRQQESNYSLLVQAARAYIREHANESLSVSSVAEAIGYSRSHLSHIYRLETGGTVYGFIQQEKQNLAEQLLLTFIHPVSDIWRELGFCSQSHFTSFFRKLTGMSPHEYRQRAKDAISANANSESTPMAAEPSRAWRFNFKDQSAEYQEALESLIAYAEEIGFKQEMYFLYCVKRGRVLELEAEFSDDRLNKTLTSLFKDNRNLAYQTFIFLLPQIHAAAVDGGLGMKSALRIYMSFFEKAQETDAHGLLELNRAAFLAFAKAVANLDSSVIG
jgi:AraC-like DNA-binding protein